jgi:glutamate N-acetyltransferase/amino-acid N-acetyltransferase
MLEVAPEFIIPSSTGIIGVPLPVEKLVTALPSLVSAKSGGEEAVHQFARAIMTTDTCPKLASVKFAVDGKRVNMLGVAKGSGMIHPNLATMLVYIFTDIEASPAELRSVLRESCRTTFNRISVDGDTSTNDTVLLMASGQSGIVARNSKREFSAAVLQICRSLADQVVADGEGVKHVVNITVEGARTEPMADAIARTIAHSMLNKTAWAGADPNWGRILAAVGRSGVKVDLANVDVYIGDQRVCRAGGAVQFDKKAAHEVMLRPRYDIRVVIGKGKGAASILTCDLTADYVHINADYST